MELTPEEHAQQIAYRDARFSKKYDGIWQNVGKCVFCDLRDKYIIYEENGVALTITLFAYIDGHLMIVPRRHVTTPKEFTPEEWETVRKLMYMAKKLIKKVHQVKGVQFIQKDGSSAQSTVAGHIHFHGIPFDSPDLNVWNYRQLENTPLENAGKYRSLGKKIEEMAKKYDEKYSEGTAQPQNDTYAFDWSDLAFGSKKPINKLDATFIAAPRQLSPKRLAQLVKAYLPKGNIVIGLSKELYVDGFDGQPQFKMLDAKVTQPIVDLVNDSSPKHKIYTLAYFQREAPFVFEKLDFRHVLLVNGSWQRTFHTRNEYYTLVNRGVTYDMISPFASEGEAHDYEASIKIKPPKNGQALSDAAMLDAAEEAAKGSFAYDWQTGAALGKKTKNGYTLLETTFNKVVPFQTYALHHGASREKNFSPPNDLNHYDAVHAEVEMVVAAGKRGISLKGTTLFINLLPCPACARMLAETDIEELVYSTDHSNGYAINLLEKAGKKVRRITKEE